MSIIDPTFPHPPKVCGGCGRPLDYLVRPDGAQGYAHAVQVFGTGEDHVPVPLDPTIENTAAVCDFCLASVPNDETGWTVVCEPFVISIPERIDQHMSSLWAACDRCQVLVSKGRWRALLVSTVDAHRARLDHPSAIAVSGIEQTMSVLLDAVRENFVEIRHAVPNELAADDPGRFG